MIGRLERKVSIDWPPQLRVYSQKIDYTGDTIVEVGTKSTTSTGNEIKISYCYHVYLCSMIEGIEGIVVNTNMFFLCCLNTIKLEPEPVFCARERVMK